MLGIPPIIRKDNNYLVNPVYLNARYEFALIDTDKEERVEIPWAARFNSMEEGTSALRKFSEEQSYVSLEIPRGYLVLIDRQAICS